jgi:hypothetical protein
MSACNFIINKFREKDNETNIDKTLEYARLTISQFIVKILMKTVFKNIKDGYAIYVFKYITPAIK